MTVTPAAEPVAWRMDYIDPQTGKWEYTVWRNKPKDYEVYPGNIVSPLFAHPPAAAPAGLQAENARLRSAITAVVRESHAATEGIVALHILATEWAQGDARPAAASLVGGAPQPEHAALMKFYGVTTLEALVDKQAHHIERLQAKLPPTPNVFAPQRVREG